MCARLWTRLRKWTLLQLYSVLVIKTYLLEKSKFPPYTFYNTFCEVTLPTNKGVFRFNFKEDRRQARESGYFPFLDVSSYLVELISPAPYDTEDNALNSRLIIVIKVNLRKIDYEVLSRLLLDLYMDALTAPKKTK